MFSMQTTLALGLFKPPLYADHLATWSCSNHLSMRTTWSLNWSCSNHLSIQTTWLLGHECSNHLSMQTTWPLGYVLSTSLCRPLDHLIILESIALSRYPSNACAPPQISQGFIYRGGRWGSFRPNTPASPPPPPNTPALSPPPPPPPPPNFL